MSVDDCDETNVRVTGGGALWRWFASCASMIAALSGAGCAQVSGLSEFDEYRLRDDTAVTTETTGSSDARTPVTMSWESASDPSNGEHSEVLNDIDCWNKAGSTQPSVGVKAKTTSVEPSNWEGYTTFEFKLLIFADPGGNLGRFQLFDTKELVACVPGSKNPEPLAPCDVDLHDCVADFCTIRRRIRDPAMFDSLNSVGQLTFSIFGGEFEGSLCIKDVYLFSEP